MWDVSFYKMKADLLGDWRVCVDGGVGLGKNHVGVQMKEWVEWIVRLPRRGIGRHTSGVRTRLSSARMTSTCPL